MDSGFAQIETVNHTGQRGLKFRLREPLRLGLPEHRHAFPIDLPLRLEQLCPVPPIIEQHLGLPHTIGLGSVFIMDACHSIGLNQYAIEKGDAENQPDAPPRPCVVGEFCREAREPLPQCAHTRTFNVISSRLSPGASSALTCSNSGTASRERT